MGRMMDALKRPFLRSEKRAVLPWNVYGDEEIGTRTVSGTRVTESSAFKYSVAYAAMTLIADGVASLPPNAYAEQEDGSRTPGVLPAWIRKPHPEMRRFDVWNQLMLSVLAWGNAYAQFIRRQSDGVIVGLWVLDPSTVEAEWDPDRSGYRRYRLNGKGQWLTSNDIFHIQGPTLPGKAKGMSVIAQARESIALGLTLEEFGARYFSQGSMAKIVLELPGQAAADETKAKQIVRTFERFHRGKANWHRPAIASGGAKIHNISIPPEDAQFLQTREHQAIDVARWYRVPPHRVGITSASTSWGSGLSEENQAMLQHTYRPWIARFQDALTAYAPGGQDLGTLILLDTSALLRGTFKEQVDVFSELFEKDILTKNEVRKELGWSKVKNGDKFFSESQPKPDPAQQNAPGGDGGGKPADPRTKEQDRLRKQEEAARGAHFDTESFRSLTQLLEKRINDAHDPHSGQFASHGGSAGTGGMKKATDADKAEYKAKTGKSIPPGWTDVEIAENLDTAALQVRAKDAKGRVQSRYSAEHTKAQSEKKFARNKELAQHTDKLDAALERDHLENDDAGALLLIRKMGMRPGSNRDTGAEKQAHGATNLKAKHVKVDEAGNLHLDFTGKDGVPIKLAVHDPMVEHTLKHRLSKGKKGDDQLFDTNEDKVRDYMRATGTPKEFLLKDLRTLHANVTALKVMNDIPAPKTKKEFLSARKRVADGVSSQLGNTPQMALSSYINPTIFGKWVLDESWLE